VTKKSQGKTKGINIKNTGKKMEKNTGQNTKFKRLNSKD
jgi:hypothetical protein